MIIHSFQQILARVYPDGLGAGHKLRSHRLRRFHHRNSRFNYLPSSPNRFKRAAMSSSSINQNRLGQSGGHDHRYYLAQSDDENQVHQPVPEAADMQPHQYDLPETTGSSVDPLEMVNIDEPNPNLIDSQYKKEEHQDATTELATTTEMATTALEYMQPDVADGDQQHETTTTISFGMDEQPAEPPLLVADETNNNDNVAEKSAPPPVVDETNVVFSPLDEHRAWFCGFLLNKTYNLRDIAVEDCNLSVGRLMCISFRDTFLHLFADLAPGCVISCDESVSTFGHHQDLSSGSAAKGDQSAHQSGAGGRHQMATMTSSLVHVFLLLGSTAFTAVFLL